MKVSKFFYFLLALFLVAVVVYIVTTPRTNGIPITGVITGNDVIVSPQVGGRLLRLLVDEGSEVKAGQLVAEIDPTELEAVRDAAAANIRTLQAKVTSSETTASWTNQQTDAAVHQAEAAVTSTQAQLEQARANLWRDQQTYNRTAGLFRSGVSSAQDRDLADAGQQASEAAMKSLENQVKVQQAQLGVAQANRKQVEVQQAETAATKAQLAQAVAQKDQAETQLSYTKVYAPINGIVSVRVARQGEMTQQGAPIVTLLDIDNLWVRADVEESLIDSIQYGQTLNVQLPSGEIIQGTVFYKGIENDFATQRDVSRTKRDIKTFSIKVRVPNPGRRLVAGMTATVILPNPTSSKGWLGRLGL
jgi:multidrug resistance efflux pump